MRGRPPTSEPRQLGVLAAVAVTATLVLVAAGGRGATAPIQRTPASWEGLAGLRGPGVALGQRMIVVLRSPSLADRVARAGGFATSEQERRWTAQALAAQNLLISRLGIQGVRIKTEFRYARVLNGFSAALDAPAVASLERAPEVAGVYPVRTAYPASLSSRILSQALFAPGMGARPDVGLPGFDGRGVTIALLDTGVDRVHPFLRGRIASGVDIVGGDAYALAAPKPDSPSELEQHGTEMAGLLVGAGGPSGLAGVATGASILPIRVGGWQQDAAGGWSIYARSDQVVAGLESAADPNGDGDAHDAARIALVGFVEPFAAFADDPAARAAAGATRLDTLVVSPAGNDGAAGPGYGTIAGPGGAPAALTVGAADLRRRTQQVRVVARAGLNIVLDERLPLGGAIGPRGPLALTVAAPGLAGTHHGRPTRSLSLAHFFDRNGLSLVAGRAALVPAGETPGVVVADAARAGAAAVLLYGSKLPPGALGLDENVAVPAVSIPPRAARSLLDVLRRGGSAGVAIGVPRVESNPSLGRVAAFSSTGLAFDGRVKPDVVAPGVGLATAEAGTNTDGSARFGTVNGTSAAAALVAGEAAVLAQARPSLHAADLKSLLVQSALPIAADPVTAQGAGVADVGAAAATELSVDPPSLALGKAAGAGWETHETITVHNVSTRTVRVRIRVERDGEGAAAVAFRATPAYVLLGRARTAEISLRVRVTSEPAGIAPAQGAIVVLPVGDAPLRIPWTVTFGGRDRKLIGYLHLSAARFAPSDTTPAILTLQAGRLVHLPTGGDEVRPLARLDLNLWGADGTSIGLLARLRDVLPGTYQFGLNGRGPAGAALEPGPYELRIVAHPADGGAAMRRIVRFTVKSG